MTRAILGLVVCGMLTPWRGEAQTVTVVNNLSFGTTIAGTTTSIGISDAAAAQWKVAGTLRLLNQVTFTLPTTLSRTGGGTLNVTYCTTCAAYNTSNTLSGATTFNPSSGATVTLAVLSSIYVWLGASISPPANQTPGTYSGTAVMTITGLGL